MVYPLPSWIHSDIMDDNILIEGITESSPSGNSKGSYETDPEKMNAIHIIDFSDLSIGEQPINLVPYYVNIDYIFLSTLK